MDKRDIDEANQILDFQESETGWKVWAAVFAAGALLYFIVSVIRSSV